MKRIPVDSSDVVSLGYDPNERTLEVEFREGRIYRYMEVPQDIYDHFLKADSYGGYFNSYINGYFRYRRVEGEAEKPKALAFVSGNGRKLRSLQKVAQEFGFEVEQLELPVDEIQSHDPGQIILHKAKQAYRLAGNRPVIVNDAFWSITALRGFPGGYMKDVIAWFKSEDFLALMEDKPDRSISCTDSLVYYDGKKAKAFSRQHWGTIAQAPKGKGRSSLDQVVVMQGEEKTIGEIEDTESRSSVDIKQTVWYEFGKWYNMQRRLKLA